MSEPRLDVSYGKGEVFRLRPREKGRESRKDLSEPSRAKRSERIRLLSLEAEQPAGKTTLLPPSRELTLKLLDTTPEEFRQLALRAAANSARQPAPAEQIEQLRGRFSRALKATIANFAFEAAEAKDAERVFLWKDGRFDNDFLDELIKALPIDLNLLGEVLEDLHRELLGTLTSQRIEGAWGFLRARGADIEVVFSRAPGEVY